MIIAMTAVPGFGGVQGAVAAVATAVVAGAVALTAAHARGAGVVTGVVVFVLAGLTLREVPSELHDRWLQYRHQAGYTTASSQADVQRSVGVDGEFLQYLQRAIPADDTFYVASGSAITTSAPQSWAQFVLMPRIEEYGRPCAADWIVFVGARPHVAGLETGSPHRFRDTDNWLAPVRGRCTR